MVRKSLSACAVSVFFLLTASQTCAADVAAKGIELYNAYKYEDAAKELRNALDADPNNPATRYYLGLSLLQLGDYKEAEEQLKKAEETKSDQLPREDQIKVGLARVAFGQKEYDKAQAYLDEAASANADNPDVHLYRGVLALHREDYSGAARELEKAIEMNPEAAYAHYYAGLAYSKLRRPDKMVNEFQMFLRLAPDAPEANKVRSLLRSVR